VDRTESIEHNNSSVTEMDNQFRDVEAEFRQLRRKYSQKEISEKEYREQLKMLRLRDKKGRYWTIGAQTGKWYFFDGKKWIPAKPPSISERKAICIFCGFENDLENESCAHCGGNLGKGEMNCPECGQELEELAQSCPHCGEELELDRNVGEIDIPEESRPHYVFRSLNPFSYCLFTGSLGLLAGVIFGAFIGASGYLPGIVKVFPSFLVEVHGNLVGGLFYAILGGVFGFALIGGLGYLFALFVNMIFSFTGGIKVRMDRTD
jgi:hypothetical protein